MGWMFRGFWDGRRLHGKLLSPARHPGLGDSLEGGLLAWPFLVDAPFVVVMVLVALEEEPRLFRDRVYPPLL